MLVNSLVLLATVLTWSLVTCEDDMTRLNACGIKAKCHYQEICKKLNQNSTLMMPIKDKCVKLPTEVAPEAVAALNTCNVHACDVAELDKCSKKQFGIANEAQLKANEDKPTKGDDLMAMYEKNKKQIADQCEAGLPCLEAESGQKELCDKATE